MLVLAVRRRAVRRRPGVAPGATGWSSPRSRWPDDLVSGRADGVHLTLTSRGRLVDGSANELLATRAAAARATRACANRARRAAGRRVGDHARRRTRAAAGPHDHDARRGSATGERSHLRTRSDRRDAARRASRRSRRTCGCRRCGCDHRSGHHRGIAGRRTRRSDVVISVGGRLAVDLDLLGVSGTKARCGGCSLGDKRSAAAARRSAACGAAGAVDRASSARSTTRPCGWIRSTLRRVAASASSPGRRTPQAAHGLEILAGLIASGDDHSTTGAGAAFRRARSGSGRRLERRRDRRADAGRPRAGRPRRRARPAAAVRPVHADGRSTVRPRSTSMPWPGKRCGCGRKAATTTACQEMVVARTRVLNSAGASVCCASPKSTPSCAGRRHRRISSPAWTPRSPRRCRWRSASTPTDAGRRESRRRPPTARAEAAGEASCTTARAHRLRQRPRRAHVGSRFAPLLPQLGGLVEPRAAACCRTSPSSPWSSACRPPSAG